MSDEPNIQPISDDQELAKVLAGVTEQAEQATDGTEAPVTDGSTLPAPTTDDPAVAPVVEPTAPVADGPAVAPIVEPVVEPMVEPFAAPSPVPAAGGGEFDNIKLEALNELRPLVDKLNVSPEEKFDTYLLLLRSTDDKNLIAPAHEAAKNIPDETRKAQALLDIIKEIDFLSGQKQAS